MGHATLFIQRRYRLGPRVLALAGVHADDLSFEPGIAKRIFRHIAALVRFNHDGVGLVLLVGSHRLPGPTSRAIFPAVITIHRELPRIATPVRACCHDSGFVALVAVCCLRVYGHH